MSAGTTRVRPLAGRECVVETQPGSGVPALFVNGCALPRGLWYPVTRELSRPAVLFDRPGLGTPWPGRPATLREEVETLAELVGEHPGCVLVAHSMGALHAEALLLTHPGMVGALVLVDPSIEWKARQPWPAPLLRQPATMYRRVVRLQDGQPFGAGFGRMTERLAGAGLGLGAALSASTQTAHGLGAPEAATLRHAYDEADAVAMAAAEWLAYRQQAADLVALREQHQLVPVPTTILTAVPHQPSSDQRRYAERLGARHVLVAHSRHLVMLDAPEAVRAAIAAPGRPEVPNTSSATGPADRRVGP